ncbi:MAG: TonB-dependent receptor [Bacteroidales bacterium]|nr:TonB-dependent receptor [Bacteroidales bacterium]
MNKVSAIFHPWIYLYPLIILLSSGVQSFAQGTGICGKVVCNSAGAALEYATVALYDTTDKLIDGAITDGNGSFHISRQNPGLYRLEISYIGYEKQARNGIVIKDKKATVDIGEIRLKPLPSQLNEISVTGEKKEIDYKIDRKVVNVAQQANAAGGSLADVLQNVPSVKVDADGNVTLRGSADFTLLIDGKPSIMDASESFKNIQAETVDKIEIITNPSAKYDAKGITGIMNVITKKKQLAGADGIVSASVANGDKYTGNLKVSNRFRRLTTFIEASFSDKWQHTKSWSERMYSASGINTTENISNDRQLQRLDAQGKIGADITTHGKSSLSWYFQAGIWKFFRGMDGLYKTMSDTMPVPLEIKTREDYTVRNYFLSGDLSYNHYFPKEGHTLSIDIFDSYLENNSPNTYVELEQGFTQQIDNSSYRNNLRAKADYTLPVSGEHTLEAGIQADIQASYYVYDYRFMNQDSSWIHNDSLSGIMNFNRGILAAYITWSGTLFGIAYQVGLRTESTLQRLVYPAGVGNARNDYLNLFPSVHLSKELDKHQFSLSYSRRINRPTEWQLCPLLYANDRFYLRKGNPQLEPEFIDAIELGYTFQIKTFDLNVETYIRKSKNSINTVVLEENDIFFETYDNLAHEFNSGIDFQVTYKPWKWLKLELSSSLYYSQWNGALSDGEKLDDHTVIYSGNFKPVFFITPTTDLTFLAIYYAPSKNIQGNASSFYYFDFIFRQQFLKKKLIFTLRTHNTFNTGLYHYTTNGESFTTENWYRYEGPVIIAGLSFKINSIKQRSSPHDVRMDFDSGLDH